MAIGTELILGYTGGDLIAAAQGLDLDVDWDKRELMSETRFVALNDRLEKAYVRSLKGMSHFKKISAIDGTILRHYHVETPLGPREMSAWRLDLDYDPHEMGDRKNDAVFGVSLIGRYYPTFLDWREPHGGSGSVIDLDRPMLSMIEVARVAIVEVLPNFDVARICLKMIHY